MESVQWPWPHTDPSAAITAEIAVVLFAGAALVFLLVMALAAYAVFGRRLRAPQALKPGSAMPDLGVTERDARDIAAFLLRT